MNSENENPNLSPYNNFMSSLTQKITVDEQLFETYQKKIFNINELQGYIETQEKLTNKELNKQIKINIGDGIFVNAIHPPSKTIILIFIKTYMYAVCMSCQTFTVCKQFNIL